MDGNPSSVNSNITILCFDEGKGTLSFLKGLFLEDECSLFCYGDIKNALAHLAEECADIIVYDMRSSLKNSLQFLEGARKFCPDATRILLGHAQSKLTAIEALAHGQAHYYILEPWTDYEIKTLIVNALRLHTKLKSQRLKSVLPLFNNLPSPPKYLSQVNEILNDPTASISLLVNEIEKNPALVAKVLQVANSAFFGARIPILSVQEAITFLGVRQIGSLVSAMEVFQRFTQCMKGNVLMAMEQIWTEGVRRAGTAKMVAECYKDAVEPHEVFVASLLQDVGYLVRLCSEPERFMDMLELHEREGISRYEADLQVFTVTHDEVGAALLEFWNFPREIVFAVANHHGDTFGDTLTQILQLAEGIETAEPNNPHDSSLNALLDEWRSRLVAVGSQ